MFKWKKHGQIFDLNLINNHKWMKNQAQNTFVLNFDDFIRVFFNTRPDVGLHDKNISYPAFVDLDKSNFKKIIRISQGPILSLGTTGSFDEFGIMAGSIIKSGTQYYLYYVGWTRMVSVPYNWAIGLAISEDGETFKKIGNGPVIGATIKEPYLQAGCSHVMKINDEWHLWYTSGVNWVIDEKPESEYRIMHATSKDGITWHRDGRCIIEPVLQNEAQASPTIIKIGESWHMFFSYRHVTDFRNKEKGYRIGYAYSKDLAHWTRDDKKAGLNVSETGWDSEMVCYPHVFELDGKIYMFYNGNDFGRSGFGYAELEM